MSVMMIVMTIVIVMIMMMLAIHSLTPLFENLQSRLSLHQTGVKDNPCGHRTSEECLTESCLVFRSLALEERKVGRKYIL